MREQLSQSARAFAGVFRNPNLRRLELAWMGSVAGSYSYSIAIAIYAYRHGGAPAVGAIALIRAIPAALTGPFVASLGDRLPRERVMLAADLGRAALCAVIAIAVLSHGPAWIVFVVAGFGPILAMAFHPAEAALLPQLARSAEELSAANVSASTIESIGAFAGPALGGVVLAAWGIGAAFVVTVATFLWSALMVARLTPPRVADEEGEASGADEHGLLGGFKAIASTPGLRVVVGLYAAQTVVAGAMGVLVVVASGAGG